MIIESRTYTQTGFSRSLISSIILTLIIFIFIITIITKNYFWALALVPLALFGDYINHTRLKPDKGFKYQISFSTDFIEIDYEKYLLEEIEKLVVEINEFDGQIIILWRGTRILNGTNNKISFTYNGLDISHKFYIPNKPRMNEFKDLYDIWYRNNIKFKEQCYGKRTYCLEDLNYKQIQEFKAKYNLEKK